MSTQGFGGWAQYPGMTSSGKCLPPPPYPIVLEHLKKIGTSISFTLLKAKDA